MMFRKPTDRTSGRSLDQISKIYGPIQVDVLGKIAVSIVGGVNYLYSRHRIMHRDVQPANILLNLKGEIKLYNFGMSSQLQHSVAETFIGTATHMSPERIQGDQYTIKSDVWSVGLTLMELATGSFPYVRDGAEEVGPLDLLQWIVLEPSPKLPESDAFPSVMADMIDKCLMKNPKDRPSPRELLVDGPPDNLFPRLIYCRMMMHFLSKPNEPLSI
jgi:mitogen-activated protein kinase kinase